MATWIEISPSTRLRSTINLVSDKTTSYYGLELTVSDTMSHIWSNMSIIFFFICWIKPKNSCSFLNYAAEPTDTYQILTEEIGILKWHVLIWVFIENINWGCLTSMGTKKTRKCMISYRLKYPPHIWWNKYAGVHILLQISIIVKYHK